MTARTIRRVIAVGACCAVGTAALLPDDAPLALLVALVAVAGIAVLLLLAERELGRWLENARGQAVGPGDFLRAEWFALFRHATFVAALGLVAVDLKLMQSARESLALMIAAGIAVAPTVLTPIVRVLFRRKARRRGAWLDLWEHSSPEPLGRGLAASLDFNKAVLRRLGSTLLKLGLGTFFATALVLAIGGSLVYLDLRLQSGGEDAPPRALRFLARTGIGLGLVGGGIILAASVLALFRIVSISRRTGRAPPPASSSSGVAPSKPSASGTRFRGLLSWGLLSARSPTSVR